jgi:hypothetical protein
MWYLQGQFTPANTSAGARFAERASVLELQSTYKDPSGAIRTLLKESPNNEGTIFLVMSLSEGIMYGRSVFDPMAVEWANAHVQE